MDKGDLSSSGSGDNAHKCDESPILWGSWVNYFVLLSKGKKNWVTQPKSVIVIIEGKG